MSEQDYGQRLEIAKREVSDIIKSILSGGGGAQSLIAQARGLISEFNLGNEFDSLLANAVNYGKAVRSRDESYVISENNTKANRGSFAQNAVDTNNKIGESFEEIEEFKKKHHHIYENDHLEKIINENPDSPAAKEAMNKLRGRYEDKEAFQKKHLTATTDLHQCKQKHADLTAEMDRMKQHPDAHHPHFKNIIHNLEHKCAHLGHEVASMEHHIEADLRRFLKFHHEKEQLKHTSSQISQSQEADEMRSKMKNILTSQEGKSAISGLQDMHVTIKNMESSKQGIGTSELHKKSDERGSDEHKQHGAHTQRILQERRRTLAQKGGPTI